MTLRVGVNMLWCVPGAVGGSEQYLVRQLEGVRSVADRGRLDVSVFATSEFNRMHAAALAGTRLVDGPGDSRRRAVRVVHESTWLYRHTGGVDVVHHGGGTAPGLSRHPYVLTVHDVQYLSFPQYFSRLKLAYLNTAMPRSARRARVVTVPSNYVKGTVVDAFGVDPARVVVVPHGYEPALLRERTPAAELRQRYGLGDGPVVVYPAMTAPHKNHRFLIELMQRSWTDPALRLVLIGGTGLADDAVTSAIAAAGPAVERRIVRAGRVSDADRNGLLAMAAALVFPSEYEGFGAPLIEAMALGTPVVCSDATCLPEVAGNAAIVCPLDLDAWADALDQVVQRRTELVAAGIERVAAYTARRSGQALLGAYELAAS